MFKNFEEGQPFQRNCNAIEAKYLIKIEKRDHPLLAESLVLIPRNIYRFVLAKLKFLDIYSLINNMNPINGNDSINGMTQLME